ncbi:MAG: hypothetical protein E7493_12655 [Ruminococcus albus]|nr:hypothetical protein [Ruminococcus albus]
MKIEVSASRYMPEDPANNTTRGFASVKFYGNTPEDEFMLERITIRETANGMFVSLPQVARNSKINGSPVYDSNGNPKKEFSEVLHPKDNPARAELCNAIMERWRANDKTFTEFNILGDKSFELTRIEVTPYSKPANHIVGIGSMTFGDAFKIDNIFIKKGQKGEYLDMPSYRNKKYDKEAKQVVIGENGQPEIEYRDIFHPNTEGAYRKMTNAMLDSLHAKQQAADNSYGYYQQQDNNYGGQQNGGYYPQPDNNYGGQQNGGYYPQPDNNYGGQQNGGYYPQQGNNYGGQQSGGYYPQQDNNYGGQQNGFPPIENGYDPLADFEDVTPVGPKR